MATAQPRTPGAPPVDPARALGLKDDDWPEMESGDTYLAAPPTLPPVVIEGLLHQGCKMTLGGTSKAKKSWVLMELALSVAAGLPWWGLGCRQAKVAYVNFELPRDFVWERERRVVAARPELAPGGRSIKFWNLRSKAGDIALLRPRLVKELSLHRFGLIIIDPIYKLLGDRDENSNTDVTSLLNELERIADQTGAAIILSHHFAKGDPTGKSPMDRMSGAGAWARDPDAILILTPHEEEECFTVSSIIRHFPALPEFVVEWQYPLMVRAKDLDPQSLRTPQSKKKLLTDREFCERFLSTAPRSQGIVVDLAKQAGISQTSAYRYITRLKNAGLIKSSNFMLWVGDERPPETETK